MRNLSPSSSGEAKPLRSQLGDRINVEVDAAPTYDLNKVLGEIRCQYETLVEKNQCETEELNKEVISSGEQLQSGQTWVIELRHTVQALEIDLQAQTSTVTLLCKTPLAETCYSNQLPELQCLISSGEAQIAELRSDTEHQNCE
ncbi:unnamed protein product [Natator depressus]